MSRFFVKTFVFFVDFAIAGLLGGFALAFVFLAFRVTFPFVAAFPFFWVLFLVGLFVVDFFDRLFVVSFGVSARATGGGFGVFFNCCLPRLGNCTTTSGAFDAANR